MYQKQQTPNSQMNEINKFRIACGLKPIRKKKVSCLSCGKEFESQDYPRQRMCERCRIEDSSYFTFSRGINQDLLAG